MFGAECEGQIGSADLKVVVDGDAFTDASHLQVNAGGTVHRPGQHRFLEWSQLSTMHCSCSSRVILSPTKLTGDEIYPNCNPGQ